MNQCHWQIWNPMQSENMAKRNGSKDMIDSTKTMMARIIKDAAGYPITVNKVKIKGCKLTPKLSGFIAVC